MAIENVSPKCLINLSIVTIIIVVSIISNNFETINCYYWQDVAADLLSASTQKTLVDSVQSTANDINNQESKLIDQTTSAVSSAANSASSTMENLGPKRDEVRKQMSSSLGNLVNKMPHALKNVYDEISPDLQGIGDGLNKAIQITRQDIAQRVEPLSHNVSPYLNRAQEAVKPFADEAQKRIGPVVNPTIEKLRAGQYREAINEVGSQAAPHIDNLRHQVSGILARVGNSTQNRLAKSSAKIASTIQDQPTQS